VENGLSHVQWAKIVRVFTEFENIQKVILFGSRAKGNWKEGSDIDLAVVARNPGFAELRQIEIGLDDLDFPYFFDVVVYNEILSKDLKDHIDRVGKIIYSQNVN